MFRDTLQRPQQPADRQGSNTRTMLTSPIERDLSALSKRERETAELVSKGHTNRQIARTLHLSHKTVETYIARIFAKLGVSSRVAVATAVTQAETPTSA
jgi:DNA-binding NarL/FixJ family response regulator